MTKISNFLKRKTIKNIGYLTIGNIFAQIFALIGAFYIPKLLGPDQYGIYNTVTAYVAIFVVFTFSGLSKVIIREAAKDTTKLKEILEATIGLRNIFSIGAMVLAIITALFINYEITTKLYIFIYSFVLLFKGVHSSLNTIFQSTQKMKILGILAVSRQIIRVPLTIFLLYLDYGVLSVLFVHLLVEIAVTIVLYIYSKKTITFNIFSKIRVIQDYLIPGFRFSLLEFLNVLSGKIDLVMLSFLTTPQNVGIYALAYRLVDKGLVLRAPISQALFPYYSKKYKESKPNISMLFKHTFFILFPMLVFIIPAIIFIESFIVKVIGIEYIQSSKIFAVLVFYLVLNFSIIPLGLALQTTSNEKFSIYTTSTISLINISLNLIFFNLFGIIGIAYSTLIVESLRLLLNSYFVKKHLL